MSSVSGRLGRTTFDSIEREVAGLGAKKRMGDAFERTVAHFLEHDRAVVFREVWLWDDWPERTTLGLKGDQGIDIVAIDAEGKRVAVQVKFHSDPERNVTQREVATLFSLRPDLFERWWIVSNAITHSAEAERATNRGDVTWVHRGRLSDSRIDWTGALDAVGGKAASVAPLLAPREPEQAAAIADTVAALLDHERVQLIMACGTGKTLVTRWITEARDDRRVLVLVPTLLLLKQFRTSWREQARTDFLDLGVCSDADTMGKDEWSVRSDELEVRVTTDPADIARFLKGRGRRVIFGTYASSVRIAEAQDLPGVPRFDLVIADEAHRVAGITTRTDTTERAQRVVLDGDRIRAKHRLFATATPRVYTASTKARLGEREDIEFASMDDPAHFGIEAHRLWFREAVELERLVDYRLSVVVVTDAEIADLVRERAVVDAQGRTLDAETLASLIAMRRAVAELGLQRAITFHSTIARARDFAAELERLEMDAPSVAAAHISGAMSMTDRERVLGTLREPERPTVVTNARCLTEGIDVPSLDAVAFVDPRSAAVDIVQAVGRVMRTADGKDLGHVIVPVFLGETDLADPEAAVESTTFAPVLAVLRALRAHDPDLVSDATRIATSLGQRDAVIGGHISEHIQFLGHEVDVSQFEQALEMRFVEISKDRWEVGLARLRGYVEREADARVPFDHVAEDGYHLGQWVNRYRSAYKLGALLPTRAADLEALPGWSWDPLSDDWEAGVAHLRSFVHEAGHAQPSAKYVSADGFRLGGWLVNRRTVYKQGLLPTDRIAELEALPGWAWQPHEDSWQEGLTHLMAYVEDTGTARPPENFVCDDGYRVGQWVGSLRQKRAKLAPERIAELEALPKWSWAAWTDRWTEGLVHLRAYAEETGSARPPDDFVTEDGFRLGGWLGRRRQERTKLSPERIGELEALPGWTWDALETAWHEGLAHLRAYAADTGSARPPKSFVSEDGFRLGDWVSTRRSERSRLTPERVGDLEAIPGWVWAPQEAAWQDGLAHLRAYVEETGSAQPRQSLSSEDGYQLGRWVAKQRSTYKRRKLAIERVAALEELPGWRWAARGPMAANGH